ncbi:hypothetical protein BHE74_00024292 [Ensete ventricosum]|nr:hypothetical protein BHE74_00024292 [Ensete ventricosum]
MELLDGELELRVIQKLEGHTDRVWGLAWNPAATGVTGMLASCSGDKTVRIWQKGPSGSWDCSAVLEDTHARTVRSCAWSPSGKLLATASFDGTTAVWEHVGGEFECVATLEVNTNDEICMVKLAVSAKGGRRRGEEKGDPGERKRGCCSLDLLPVGDFFSPHGEKKHLPAWEKERDDIALFFLSHLCTLSGYHDRTIFSVHWSREGLIVSGAADDAIRLFTESKDSLVDQPSYKMLVKKEKAHDMDVNSVQWNLKEPRLLASASDDGTIKIWELSEVSK